jgi:hypothetical protein
MDSRQKYTLVILLVISAIYFSLFIFPNNTGAEDPMMISLFETDEFAQYPVVMRMLSPQEAFDKTVLNFIKYRHYYYGSPFYFSSAMILLPLGLVSSLENSQLNMLLLRQLISVLPMLGALMVFTYLPTKFRSRWKSIALFILLLSVSAVVENNLWWHVDSLAVLFIALTFLFLDLDSLHYGRFFYFGAVSTGLAAGTKVIGLFFFLAIPVYLFFGLVRRQISWRNAFAHAAGFVLIMSAVIVASNPFLFLEGEYSAMITTLSRQSRSMSAGWVLSYDKGPASWLPILKSLYGNIAFFILALIALILGIRNPETRLRTSLIAAWAVPFGLYVLFTVAIKPSHFFLPILLPVFSTLAIYFDLPLFGNGNRVELDGRVTRTTNNLLFNRIIAGLVIGIMCVQFVSYLSKDIDLYSSVLYREQEEASLVFYRILEGEYLPLIQADDTLVVFRDVRMYFPEDPRWIVRTYWNSSYRTIDKIKPDLIILWAQRILDYTQAGAREKAVNPESFQDTYQFYVDADSDQLRGYRLVYRNAEGLFFVSEKLYEDFIK